ncbi:hypothetical protein BCR42DRAFT_401285 [Absidia repens]|uniref:Uncharacterized protein n=1 Tax=Absidia repens TaxID=90262 RepID=A0A1X2J2D6_9FUNG|nr:hypothetical protein BCR42DRAFT_401285 [Absidia repens]
MTLEYESSRFEIPQLSTIHSQTRAPLQPRLVSAPIPSPLRAHDTLASLYKRYTTLNQQIRSTRILLEQQQSDNQHSLILATARDRANGKLQRKLNQLSEATYTGSSSPDSSRPFTPPTKVDLQARKQHCTLILDEYQQWQETVQQHEKQLEMATYRSNQAQQQLINLQHIHTSSTGNDYRYSHRYRDLEMRHALLDTLNAVKQLYMDSLDTMASRWGAWLLADDGQVIHTPQALTYMTRLNQIKQDYQQYVDQDRTIQLEINSLTTRLEEVDTP